MTGWLRRVTGRMYFKDGELTAYSFAVFFGLLGGWVGGAALVLLYALVRRPMRYDAPPLRAVVEALEGFVFVSIFSIPFAILVFLPVWGALLLPTAYLVRLAEARGWRDGRRACAVGAAMGVLAVIAVFGLAAAWTPGPLSASDVRGALALSLLGIPGGCVAAWVYLRQTADLASR
ncbi:MAG: hypothetical protein AAF321_07880 [Pseudomonadota bacterium]